jgi:hypothetical protein
MCSNFFGAFETRYYRRSRIKGETKSIEVQHSSVPTPLNEMSVTCPSLIINGNAPLLQRDPCL